MDNSNTENTTNSFMYKVKEEFKDVKGDLGPLLKQLTFLMIAALLFLILTKPNKNTKDAPVPPNEKVEDFVPEETGPVPQKIVPWKDWRIQLGADCVSPTKVASWKNWRIQLNHTNENEH